MDRSPRSRRRHAAKKPVQHPQGNPMLKTLLCAIAIALIVVLCVAVNSVMPKIDPAVFEPTPTPLNGTPTPLPTATPLPTITPTPAIFAPFGAQ